MRILIITARYMSSGVPLAQIRLARALERQMHQVKLIFCYAHPDHTIPPTDDLCIEVWSLPQVRNSLLPLSREFRLQKPDIIFSAEDHMTAIVLAAAVLSRTTAKISGSSRILPSDRFAYSNLLLSKGWLLKQAMRLVMWRASSLTCVSQDMVHYYRNIFPAGPHVCVYNIIKDSLSDHRAQEAVSHPWLEYKEIPVVVAAGTLTKRKGFFDLLNAISIFKQRRQVRLILLGEGYLRSSLLELCTALSIDDIVDMPGNVLNPLSYFSRSDVFVLSSYSEGMPNVLVEAMMCGCTPVATDCPTGPRELLQDGKYGYLVPMHEPSLMAIGIEKALDHPISRTLLDEAVAPFEEGRVINRHFDLLGL